ncbi:bromodomain-containing protein DDB_G0280777 isoform X1 [Nasonia vitripennis]|uniref:Chitin-binding type-2 domain-containing protein n=2 Tax=Nasonia vitripennis TaxID=7425 RepID=A0A7M7R2G8_NASVI|nr:bromodomain-containing protein DDB_G0280777 isoform X1 [Nasonia vitripennis]
MNRLIIIRTLFSVTVILSILNFKHGFRLCSAGEPGYLDFDNLPETNFSCQGKVIGGYYADVEAGCQMFHVCTIGQKDEIMDIKFLCLNGTVFDQETRVCERVDEVDCSKSERFYNLNLELYGNHAVTLSLHEQEDEDESTESREDQQQQQHMTSVRPSTTTTTTTTTSRPSQPSTTSANNVYQQHPTGYPQHYQPRPAFPSVQTSQSNTHYDDKNGGYHHQYIFHNDERNINNQATSYQLFSNQGVSSTTPTPQVHQQVRYSSTANPQVIRNEPSTVTPLQYHVQSTSSTIQTLLNNNANNPSIINPLFHNHGIASTTEQFNVHNNNPREIIEYQDSSEDEEDERDDRRPLEAVQSTNKGKVSNLSISPVPQQENRQQVVQNKNNQASQQQQQRISINYLPTPSPIQTTIGAFYPTQRSMSQKSQKSENNQPQHIHVPPPPSIPQLKPHQITINLPPPDIQRIVQNPSPLLPSQSRVIVTAKASVSDESGRPLNASQLITLPLPTIPSNYDDYKEGDESFDPFYRDVPKIRNDRRIVISRKVETNERSSRKRRSTVYQESEDSYPSEEVIFNAEIKDIKDLKANLPIIKAFLFGLPIPENLKSTENVTDDDNVENVDMKDINRTLPVTNKSRKNIANTDSIRVDSKMLKNPKNIRSLISQIEEYDDEDVDVPDITEKEVHRIRTGTRTEALRSGQKIRQRTPPALHRQLNLTPVVNEHDADDAEPKDTVQLFLRSVEGNNSISNNVNFSVPIENLNSSNETLEAIDTPDKIKQKLLQTRSSSNSNKSNRRKTLRSQSAEDSEEYEPRRNSRVSHPKSSAYYDEYDVSESIELGSRHRSNRLRQRPSNRRRISYRDDYIDGDNIEGDDYEEESVNLHRKSSLRRGPQGRRVPSRNRNRHFDYEDDEEEVDEKPKVRTKVSNSSSRSRGKANTERFSEDIRHNIESDRRKNTRKRPLPASDELPGKDKPEFIDEKIFESSLKSSKNFNSQEIVQDEKANIRSSIKSEQPNRYQQQFKKQHKNLNRDEVSDEEQGDEIQDDYFDEREAYLDEYNESLEEIPDDYADYPISREVLSKTRVPNRRNRNRLNNESKSISQEKSYRQDKSRKFNEKPRVEKEDVTAKIESTTLLRNEDSVTTNIPLDYTIPEGEMSSQEYEDYNLPKTTLKVDDADNSELPESVKSTTENMSTEGVFKFTDELPQTEKKEVVKDHDKQKDTIPVSYEDYVDDNYEPESYTDPQINKLLSLSEKTEEQNNMHVASTRDKSKEVESRNDKKASDIANSKIENKDEYDEVYGDKIESTTVSFSTEEYDDLETTTETILTSTTSVPIVSSTIVSTSLSSVKTTITTTPRTTMSTTDCTTTSTTTTSTTTTPAPTTSLTTTTTTSTTPIPTTTSAFTPRAKTTTKFFKPTAFRKNYAYSLPSTSPNSVVIRRGQPLSGPKPTKPPPSYNELAPKPVIRRLPLLSRTTTTTSEATILESEIVAQLSKYLVEEVSKNVDESNYPPNVNVPLETVTANPSSTSPSTVQSSEYIDTTTVDNLEDVKETIEAQEKNQTLQTIDQKFDNEVSKQSSNSQDSNNVPQTSNESVMFKSIEDSSKSETMTKKVETTSKLLDMQTTTLRTFRPSERRKLELTSVKSQIHKTNQGPKMTAGFNCLEKEMYRFYGDMRDCRLFHYCSPGFTARQVLDFRFVCEEGTIFDEESQSCRHDVPNPKCSKKTW